MEDGVLGFVKVAYSLDSPVSWVPVPGLLDIKFPTSVADQIDTTVHGITKRKRKMPGMIETSDTTLSLLWDPDETTTPAHDALMDLQEAGTTVWWRIEVAANRELTKWKPFEFKGFVKSAEPGTPMNDKDTLGVAIGFDGDDIYRYPTTETSAIS